MGRGQARPGQLVRQGPLSIARPGLIGPGRLWRHAAMTGGTVKSRVF